MIGRYFSTMAHPLRGVRFEILSNGIASFLPGSTHRGTARSAILLMTSQIAVGLTGPGAKSVHLPRPSNRAYNQPRVTGRTPSAGRAEPT